MDNFDFYVYIKRFRKYRNSTMRSNQLYKSSIRQKKLRIKKGMQETRDWQAGLKRNEYDYLVDHNQIRTEYHNGEYKNACNMAFELQPPHQKYLNLYYQDLLTSVNKVFKSLILRNQLSVEGTKLYFERGELVLNKFYESFIKDETITSNLKAVNTEMQTKITRFLMSMVCFLKKAAFVKSAQSKVSEARNLFEVGYSLCTNIISSSTRNYKILKKSSECLLCYSAFLIDNKEIDKAIEVLFLVLRNETNIAIILSYRLKNKQKSQAKNIRAELYNRLYAALFNLAQCYQIKKFMHHSYFFLRECELISYLKTEQAQKQIKGHLGSFVRNLQQIYQQYQELNIILSSYFNPNQIETPQVDLKVRVIAPNNYQEPFRSEKTVSNSADNLNKPPKAHRNLVKRSISLQDKLNQINTKQIIKEFGKEILFFGINLFDKKKPRSKNSTHVKPRQTHQSDRNQLSRAYLASTMIFQGLQPIKKESKLKKKVKVMKNTEFRTIKKPIEYQVLQKRVQNMWKQQSLQANKSKQKMYLLRYKSQYLNYKQIAKQNKHLFEEIQLCNNKQVAYRQSTKAVSKKEQENQSGINLFKKILLKHAKKLNLKKSQTIYILKKKSTSTADTYQFRKSCSAATESINFLMQKLKRQKERFSAKNSHQSNYNQYDYLYGERSKNKVNVSNVFLTKDTVQMPNLFISYITSQALNNDILSAILQYGMILLKHKQ